LFPDGSKPRQSQQLKIYNDDEKYIGAPKYTKGQSDWEGWGSALKPANEPICLARKPLSEKSIAENVLKWGTGGINVDGCRIGSDKIKSPQHNTSEFKNVRTSGEYENTYNGTINEHEGRFPANIILDEIAAEMLDKQSGTSKSSKSNKIYENDTSGRYVANCASGIRNPESTYGDTGGASRFFYQAKVSKAERNMGLNGFDEKEVVRQGLAGENNNPIHKNSHPTVKPVALMTYLCRLITPPNGIVLDPFMGSGSTGISALLEGFRFCGMEQDKSYFDIASARIENYEEYRKFIKK
jgi:site-specific DNA-methyltransferase (adenine-specific)